VFPPPLLFVHLERIDDAIRETFGPGSLATQAALRTIFSYIEPIQAAVSKCSAFSGLTYNRREHVLLQCRPHLSSSLLYHSASLGVSQLQRQQLVQLGDQLEGDWVSPSSTGRACARRGPSTSYDAHKVASYR
jgi:hypothetical protein